MLVFLDVCAQTAEKLMGLNKTHVVTHLRAFEAMYMRAWRMAGRRQQASDHQRLLLDS